MTTAGLRIGKYEVRERLGKGGFGVVHLGRDLELGREVAIKFLRPEYMERVQVMSRFLQEARACAKIGHPGIVTVFEAGLVDAPGERFDGTAYIVMERLHGECLGDRIKNRGKLAPIAAIGIARQLAGALRVAHEAGIIHRDLKPDNVYLIKDAAVVGGERVKILDFGVAKLLDPDDENVHTNSRIMLGTPRYMSPEQARSAGKVDLRTDIYGLGCLLYEVICGKPPFSGDVGDILVAHQTAPIVPPRELVPSVPAALDELIVRMLAKDPAERPSSMAAIDEALDGVFGSIAPPKRAPTQGDDDDKTTRKVKPEQLAAVAPALLPTIAEQATDRVELTTPTATTMVKPRVTQRIQSSVAAKIAIGVGAAVMSGVIAYLLLRGDKQPPQVATQTADAAVAVDANEPVVATKPVNDAAVASIDKILTRCKELIIAHDWVRVSECGNELTKAGGDGSELVQRATHEASAEVAMRDLRKAIEAKDFKAAHRSFNLIPETSVYAKEAERDFGPFKRAFIDEAVADLDRLTADCAAWAVRMRLAEELGGTLIGDSITKRARPCNKAAGTSSPAGSAKDPEVCDHNFVELQINRGDNLLASGAYAPAVAAYEQVIKCRPDQINKLYMAACHAKQFTKAKRAFAQLGARKDQMVQVCMREGFDPR